MNNKIITKLDVEGARIVLKNSINPKEIKVAQEVIKKFKEQNRRD